MKRLILLAAAVSLPALMLLTACNDQGARRGFDIEVDNLTEQQPFAPILAVLHRDGYHAYTLASPASTALELMAEGGDISALANEAAGNPRVLGSSSTAGKIPPGGKESLQVKGLTSRPRLSLTGMLVNTNDGFVGLDSIALDSLDRGDALVVYARVYDAGTEANSEAAATVPGQGGEGMNPARDDRNFVTGHPGVVSGDDGLGGSALSQAHRFDNPAARIVITRTF